MRLLISAYLMIFSSFSYNEHIVIKGKVCNASNVGRVCGAYLDELVVINNSIDTIYLYEFNILHNWKSLGKFGNSCNLFLDSVYSFYLNEVEFNKIDTTCFYVSLNLNTPQKRIEYRNKFFNQYFISDTTGLELEDDPYIRCDSIIGRNYHCMLVELKGRLYKLDSISPCVR